jgi:hypothetical protein
MTSLDRDKHRLDERITELDREASALRASRDAVNERRRLLRAMLGHNSYGAAGEVLVGARIRNVAARVLYEHAGTAPMHYRAWLDLLTKRGYVILGKRSTATFLTAVSRHPAVKRCDQAGVYRLDSSVLPRLRQELAEAEAELADVTSLVRAAANPRHDLMQHKVGMAATVRACARRVAEAERALAPVNGNGTAS